MPTRPGEPKADAVMTFEEIAEVMGTTEEAVYKVYKRAMGKLRSMNRKRRFRAIKRVADTKLAYHHNSTGKRSGDIY